MRQYRTWLIWSGTTKASLETDSLISAGTGFHHHREAEIEFTVEGPEPIIIPKETFDDENAATA